jgi:NitT/TauT family transport system substrate-binding protein
MATMGSKTKRGSIIRQGVLAAFLIPLLAACGGEAATPTSLPASTATVGATQSVATATTATTATTASAAATATTATTQPAATATKQAANASPSAMKPAKLILNFLAGGPQAGFMYAKKLGYYKDAGIDLTIEEGKGSATTAQQIAAGQAEFGFADGPAAMQVRSKGGNVKIIAPVLQTNGFAVISLKEKNITKVSDLVGKTLAVQPGTAQTALLDAVFLANDVDKTKVNIVNLDPAALNSSLLQGQVDAILAGADFQGVQIQNQGKEINQIFYRDAGVPTIGLAIIARDETIQNDPDLVSRFVAASLKGWDAARKDPDAAAAAVVEQFVSGKKGEILQQLNVDLQLVCAPGAATLGAPPEKNWGLTFDLLTKYQAFPTTPPITDYYTTQFVPADAPTCP